MSLDKTFRDYENDPHFRKLVDHMMYALSHLRTTPSELRAAVMCAAIKLDMLKVHDTPMFFIKHPDGTIEPGPSPFNNW